MTNLARALSSVPEGEVVPFGTRMFALALALPPGEFTDRLSELALAVIESGVDGSRFIQHMDSGPAFGELVADPSAEVPWGFDSPM